MSIVPQLRPRGAARLAAALLLALPACAPAPAPAPAPAAPAAVSLETPSARDAAFLDTLQRRTFDYFWETTNPRNGLAPDRWPDPPFASIAAIGFALSAYPVGVERGWVGRDAAAARTLTTLRFLYELPQGPAAAGTAGDHGFFYHFLDMETGLRYRTTELSTIDTALLIAGVVFCGEYFDGDAAGERAIRAYADSLYRRVEWPYFLRGRAPLITMAWRPERGFGPAAYEGYDEAMILYLLALGSPTHPIGAESWDAFTSSYDWATFYGEEHVNFAPLFGHQYSHVWVDFRGILDEYMAGRGGPSAGGARSIDYFENSRRATLAQRRYAIDNPGGFAGYGADVWGLTASDGPADTTVVVDGVSRRFRTYWARGAAAGDIRDDGTIAPTAAGGSVPFAPAVTAAALRAMRERYGDALFTRYGFLDAFNPTLRDTAVRLRRGRVVPGVGWFDDNYIGIDQGPIVTMIENWRSGLVWSTMRRSPHIVRGLCRAGFEGGWLEGRCEVAR
ncbi:MAG TPA: glucoamylase family protein [Gemmatimonadaceae bacterium]